jgi:hypothetical protein
MMFAPRRYEAHRNLTQGMPVPCPEEALRIRHPKAGTRHAALSGQSATWPLSFYIPVTPLSFSGPPLLRLWHSRPWQLLIPCLGPSNFAGHGQGYPSGPSNYAGHGQGYPQGAYDPSQQYFAMSDIAPLPSAPVPYDEPMPLVGAIQPPGAQLPPPDL